MAPRQLTCGVTEILRDRTVPYLDKAQQDRGPLSYILDREQRGRNARETANQSLPVSLPMSRKTPMRVVVTACGICDR